MTKDRSRNRPGRGPSNTGFRPPGRGPNAARGRSQHGAVGGSPEAETAGDSDKPWEKRSPVRPAIGAAPERREAKSWSKLKPGGKGGAGGAGSGKPRFDRPKASGATPQGSPGRGPDRSARQSRPDKAIGSDQDDAVAFDIDGDDAAATRSGDHGERASGARDRRPGRGQRPRFERREASFEEGGDVWIWGLHAVGAVLANPKRKIREAILTRNAAQRLGLDPEAPPAFVKLLEPWDIDARLPEGAVHQGATVRAAPLEALDIADLATHTERPLVILDQLTDPQNVGAVFRSAAAFGFGGVVMQTRRAPALGGALAKAAAGGIEATPEVRAVNLARAIDALTDAGWLVVGLAGEATTTLAEALEAEGPLAIVLGAEGAGLRPAVANACSLLAKIPMPGDMESLNVSNAAAIAFYEASRRKR